MRMMLPGAENFLQQKNILLLPNHIFRCFVLDVAGVSARKSKEMDKRILVAENDPDILYILTLILSQAGYKVHPVSEGTSIVESKIDLPDLFILDKDIPLIDGFALCKYLKVKNETKHIPIIMISAYHGLRSKAKAIGVDAFLEKPFQVTSLLQTIRKYVDTETAPVDLGQHGVTTSPTHQLLPRSG